MSRGRCAPNLSGEEKKPSRVTILEGLANFFNSNRGRMVSINVVEILIDKEDRSWGTLAKVISLV